ncbi:MAG: hypothetical protein WKG01_29365 [Kofleriaceae bacterium]
MPHRWQFFRAGGVDQVSLQDAGDLRALSELDLKLWVALAMPIVGVDIDPETLKHLDLEGDGRIRAHDIRVAVEWVDKTFVKPDDILIGADSVPLSAIKDAAVLASAKRMLKDLGKPDATSITIDDADKITHAFAETVLNGDGVIVPRSTEDAELRRAIEDAIVATGGMPDRSGKPGIDQEHADTFFTAVDQRVAWIRRGNEAALHPLGAGTVAAADALVAVRAKLEDHFTRCRIAAYDPRGAIAMSGLDTELAAVATRALTLDDDELAKLPLSKIEATGRLPLRTGLNPGWGDKIAAFDRAAITPVLGPRDALTASELAQITDKLAAFELWRFEQPKTIVDALDPAWLEQLAAPGLRIRITEVIAADLALGAEYDLITSVAKTVRLQRDFGRVLRNFVNFSDFYGPKRDGIFQTGTLYLDARAMHLCVPVVDAAKHAALAASSDSYLVYVDLTRATDKRTVAAAITNGDGENLFVGRNGVFYDRAGLDWDATIIKIVGNPISIREAFWMPYKKLARVIENNVTRRAEASDTASNAKLDAVGKTVAHADVHAPAAPAGAPAPVPAPAPAASPAAAPKTKIDLGTVAAIGVAIGGIGTLFGALLAVMFGLGPWLPIGIAGLLLLISGPSMLLAWLKLRRRNLGPILDANGWAINNRAKVNVAFGATLTELAKLPSNSQRRSTTRSPTRRRRGSAGSR